MSTIQQEIQQLLENRIIVVMRRRQQQRQRRVSLTDAEEYFLHSLLVDNDDDPQQQHHHLPVAEGGEQEAPAAVGKDEINRGNTNTTNNQQHHHLRRDKNMMMMTRGESAAVLDDDILFSLPPTARTTSCFPTIFSNNKQQKTSKEQNKKNIMPINNSNNNNNNNNNKKVRRPSNRWLWRAHADGVSPRELAMRGTVPNKDREDKGKDKDKDKDKDNKNMGQQPEKIIDKPLDEIRASDLLQQPAHHDGEEEYNDDDNDDDDDARSDEEVRHEHNKDDDDDSEASSWDEEDHIDHYDAWEVMKNEYSEEFGFNYSSVSSCSSSSSASVIVRNEKGKKHNMFQILGTSVDDISVQPHVMSPPLMDAIMNSIPNGLVGENYWLKFSLVRDGASLETLKRYTRASQYTVIAIETPKGEVFGSFTTSAWRNHHGFYGSADGDSFVWKMRHNRRRTKCHSLFDQARLESEVDIYKLCVNSNNMNGRYIQVCRNDVLAVGGDEEVITTTTTTNQTNQTNSRSPEHIGFAFALEGDLLQGTTSPTNTFNSPSLVCGRNGGDSTDVFDVCGIEVWTFTPCFDVKSAERMEMTKFFIEESSRSSSSSSSTMIPSERSVSANHSSSSSRRFFSSDDLNQEKFYQRVGYDIESAERRERWQYRNMMDGSATRSTSGIMTTSPRFM